MRTSIFRFFILLLFLCFYTTTYATVWTVSNDVTRPAQFTTLAAAINAASPGDTLRIAGSNVNYNIESTPILFKLTFIGEGANNPNGFNTKIYGLKIQRLNSSLGSDGCKFYGIRFEGSTIYSSYSPSLTVNANFAGSLANQRNLSNILFERCEFIADVKFSVVSDEKYTNFLFRNCLFHAINEFSGTPSNSPYTNIVITNCIFTNAAATINSTVNNAINGSILIRNSLFLNSAAPRFVNVNGIIVENSIFYKSEPTGAINSVFNNSITYLANNNTLPYGGNAGSGNLINVNPMFINYPALGANFEWTHNYGLQVGSPAIGTGSNGTNIGLTGGNAPVNNIPGNSRIPVVTALTLPTSSVPVGGTLEINIQAISRN